MCRGERRLWCPETLLQRAASAPRSPRPLPESCPDAGWAAHDKRHLRNTLVQSISKWQHVNFVPLKTSRTWMLGCSPCCPFCSPALTPTATPSSTSCTTSSGLNHTTPHCFDQSWPDATSVKLYSVPFLNLISFLQSLWEAGHQQDVSAESGHSVWSQPLTPPGGRTGARRACYGYLPGGGGAGEPGAQISHRKMS